MSPPSGLTNDPQVPICEDLKPNCLGGAGVPCAESVDSFTSKNNAWNVVCVSTQTPAKDVNLSEVAFLITRNVTIDRHVNALSTLKLSKNTPVRINRCVYLTYGGACIDRREKWMNTPAGLSCVFEGMGTNTTFDVMFP